VVSTEEYREVVAMRARGCSFAEIAEHFGVNVGAVQQRYYRVTQRRGDIPMPGSLKAETVIEREIARFEHRQQKATAEAREAGEQVERLRLALSALSNGKPVK